MISFGGTKCSLTVKNAASVTAGMLLIAQKAAISGWGYGVWSGRCREEGGSSYVRIVQPSSLFGREGVFPK